MTIIHTTYVFILEIALAVIAGSYLQYMGFWSGLARVLKFLAWELWAKLFNKIGSIPAWFRNQEGGE